MAFAPQIRPGVRAGAVVAVLLAAAVAAAWPRPARWLASGRWSLRASLVLVAIVAAVVVGLLIDHTTRRPAEPEEDLT